MKEPAPITSVHPEFRFASDGATIQWTVKVTYAHVATVNEFLGKQGEHRYECYGRHEKREHTRTRACRHIDAVKAEAAAHLEYYRFSYPDTATLESLALRLDALRGQVEELYQPVVAMGRATVPPINPLERGDLENTVRGIGSAISELRGMHRARTRFPIEPPAAEEKT